MSLIEWKPEFELGVPDVDHEHRELIELINAIYSFIEDGASPEHVIDALGDIYAHISAHFALEEKIMREAHYGQYPDHKADHERLLDQLRDIMDDVEDDVSYDPERLSHDLEQWFTVHFRTFDAELHAHGL